MLTVEHLSAQKILKLRIEQPVWNTVHYVLLLSMWSLILVCHIFNLTWESEARVSTNIAPMSPWIFNFRNQDGWLKWTWQFKQLMSASCLDKQDHHWKTSMLLYILSRQQHLVSINIHWYFGWTSQGLRSSAWKIWRIFLRYGEIWHTRETGSTRGTSRMGKLSGLHHKTLQISWNVQIHWNLS